MTHTIKQKATRPIVTFRTKTWQKLRADPEAANLAIGWMCERYELLTGKTLHVNWDQAKELQVLLKASEDGSWAPMLFTNERYLGYHCFKVGFLGHSFKDIEQAFDVAHMMLSIFRALEKVMDTKPNQHFSISGKVAKL
jgi:hypothetical protein